MLSESGCVKSRVPLLFSLGSLEIEDNLIFLMKVTFTNKSFPIELDKIPRPILGKIGKLKKFVFCSCPTLFSEPHCLLGKHPLLFLPSLPSHPGLTSGSFSRDISLSSSTLLGFCYLNTGVNK